jgi:ABC-2 type transport system ATP-binding protein
MRDDSAKLDPIIAVTKLCKRFGTRMAIQDFSLTLMKGEILGLVGANGGGKTTTLRMLAGLLKPDSGSGTVLEFDLLQGRQHMRPHIGYVSQGFSLYPTLSVLENLRFRAAVYSIKDERSACDAIIKKFNLEPFRHVRSEQLSGGWKTLLQVAAVTVHRPSLILMDEPTTGLDIAHRQLVWQHFIDLANSGTALVISTHDLNEAHRCSQVALLAAGKVHAVGSTQAIIDQCGMTALLVTGDNALRLRHHLSQCNGVMATYSQGTHLRVIALPQAVSAILQAVHEHTCTASLSTVTFEDAALAFSAIHGDRAA